MISHPVILCTTFSVLIMTMTAVYLLYKEVDKLGRLRRIDLDSLKERFLAAERYSNAAMSKACSFAFEIVDHAKRISDLRKDMDFQNKVADNFERQFMELQDIMEPLREASNILSLQRKLRDTKEDAAYYQELIKQAKRKKA